MSGSFLMVTLTCKLACLIGTLRSRSCERECSNGDPDVPTGIVGQYT